MDSALRPEIEAYLKCLDEIHRRIQHVRAVLTGEMKIGNQEATIELVFVQLRKILELIAFSSLTANKEKYSIAHSNFARHWQAKGILQEVEKLNPCFYPVLLQLPVTIRAGRKHSELVPEGYLTRDDFELLYQKSSDILHARNPFSDKGTLVEIGYSVEEWVSRIQTLLRLHLVHLVDNETKWVGEIRDDGSVHLYPLQAVDGPEESG